MVAGVRSGANQGVRIELRSRRSNVPKCAFDVPNKPAEGALRVRPNPVRNMTYGEACHILQTCHT